MAHVSLITLDAAAFDIDDLPILAGDAECGKTRLANSGRRALAFDPDQSEAAFSPQFTMPGNYAGGTLMATAKGCFASETTVTNEAVIQIAFEAVTMGSDSEDLDADEGFDTYNTGVEIDPPGTAGYPFEAESTLTNKDSVAAGDLCRLAIRRDHDDAADEASGDLYVLEIELWEST